MSTNDGNKLQEFENIKERQRLHRNMLSRTRYAQMSAERKQQFLSQQQARRAEAKKARLLQHASGPNNYNENQNTPPILNYSTATDEEDDVLTTEKTTCPSIFEVGSTSGRCEVVQGRCEVVQKVSSLMVTSNTGGTGKTFLYRALLANVRSKGYIALATATSGVAASILPGGRTAHSRFKIPIDIDSNFTCNISKQSSLATLIRDSKLIVWDEVSMAKGKMIQALDTLLKDLTDKSTLFGGKVVVFGGDFRQTLPVVRSGKREDFVSESLLYSNIWNQLEKLYLSENMRAKEDPIFSEYLMRIGNGQETTNRNNKIEIPHNFIIPFTNETESLNKLFKEIYPNIEAFFADPSSVTSRVILTTKNDFVNEINDMLIQQLPNDAKIYTAFDETIESSDQCQFEDFLHTLNPANLPPFKLTLKKNCPVILLRNLNPSEGLCNGTRLICNNFNDHVISATIASGDFKNTHVFIPRIPLLASADEKLPVDFKRTQFPIRLCFAMTINKAQGQTLDFVGIYLPEPVFSHGQLYVALSRAKSSKNVKVLIRPPTIEDTDDHSTYNIVYEEIIQKAFT